MKDMQTRLSTLWIFATLNYLYCDVVALMNPPLLRAYLTGHVGNVEITQGFLLAAGALVEIPMAMVVMSRVLSYTPARWANVVAGGLMTIVQVASLFIAPPALYYVFFSAIEIGSTALIVGSAWRWRVEAARPTGAGQMPEVGAAAVGS